MKSRSQRKELMYKKKMELGSKYLDFGFYDKQYLDSTLKSNIWTRAFKEKLSWTSPNVSKSTTVKIKKAKSSAKGYEQLLEKADSLGCQNVKDLFNLLKDAFPKEAKS